MNQDPLLDRGYVDDHGHSWTCHVLFVGYVVDWWIPVLEIFGYLVRELLAVLGIPLVTVVADEGVIIDTVIVSI